MAYLIDANGEELNVGSPAILDSIATLTAHCWVYLTASDTTVRRIFDKAKGGGWEIIHRVTSATDRLRFDRTWNGSTIEWNADNPPQATWFHLGATYDLGSTTNNALIYFDGVSQSVNEIGGPPTDPVADDAAAELVFGNIDHATVDGERPINGRMAEICIHNVILAPNEIKAAMRGIVHRGLVGYWPGMDGGTDFSGQGNDATVTNATLIGHPPIAPRFGVDIDWPPAVVAAEYLPWDQAHTPQHQTLMAS